MSDALVPLKKKRRSGPFTVGSVTFPHLTAAAAHHGISKNLAHFRMQAGWSIPQTFGLEPAQHSVTVGSRTFRSLPVAAAAHQICPVVVRSRLARGWGVSDALTLTSHQRPKRIKLTRVYVVSSPQGTQLRVEKLERFARCFGIEPELFRILITDPTLSWQNWRCQPATAADEAVPRWSEAAPFEVLTLEACDPPGGLSHAQFISQLQGTIAL
jgi:hypothetical protein